MWDISLLFSYFFRRAKQKQIMKQEISVRFDRKDYRKLLTQTSWYTYYKPLTGRSHWQSMVNQTEHKDKGTSQASSQRKIVYSLFSLLARSFYSTLPGTSERATYRQTKNPKAASILYRLVKSCTGQWHSLKSSKFTTVTAKELTSRQKEKPHGRKKNHTAKRKTSRQKE